MYKPEKLWKISIYQHWLCPHHDYNIWLLTMIQVAMLMCKYTLVHHLYWFILCFAVVLSVILMLENKLKCKCAFGKRWKIMIWKIAEGQLKRIHMKYHTSIVYGSCFSFASYILLHRVFSSCNRNDSNVIAIQIEMSSALLLFSEINHKRKNRKNHANDSRDCSEK